MRKLLDLSVLLLPTAIWASLVVVGPGVLSEMGPSTLSFITWAVGALLLLAVTAQSLLRHTHELKRESWLLTLCALTGITAFQSLWYAGLMTSSPVHTAILTATLPVMIAGASAVFLHEHLNRLQLVGVVVAILGALWVAVSGDLTQIHLLQSGRGDLLILLANLSMTVYTILLKRWPSALPPLDFMAATAVIGTVALFPAALFETGLTAAQWQTAIPHWSAILYIGVFASAAAYILWNYSVARNGANITAMSLYLQPAFALAFCWIFLGQGLLSYQWTGLFMIVAGITLIVFRQEKTASLREELT